jgi:hypothetical protein
MATEKMVNVTIKEEGRVVKFSLGPSAGKTVVWILVVLTGAVLLATGVLKPFDLRAWFRVPW